MNGYIMNFAVYTMAMIGFFALALLVYKKSMNFNQNNNNKDFLKVENSLRLSPSKTIYVLKAGKERFLIASDPGNTSMLSKLDENNNEHINNINIKEFKQTQNTVKRINRG